MMLNDTIIAKIQEIAARYPAIERVVLFGSRARGDCGTTSDIDLLVYADDEYTLFAYDLEEEAPTLLAFDVTQFTQTLDALFLEQVRKDGVILYDKSGI